MAEFLSCRPVLHQATRVPLWKEADSPASRRLLEAAEFRRLVEAIHEPGLRAMVVLMGKTGIRKGEALNLHWDRIDLRQGMLTVDQAKSVKIREVPLSPFARETLHGLTRFLSTPMTFVNTCTGRPWVNPEKAFKAGCRRAGLSWVGFHDLRRFRATQWVRAGIDIRTVKELLGHADIQTTMRYVRFAQSALKEVRKAQEMGCQVVERKWETNGRQAL